MKAIETKVYLPDSNKDQSSSVNKVKREKNVLTRLLNFSGHISPNKLRAIIADIHVIIIIINVILAIAGNAFEHVLTIV